MCGFLCVGLLLTSTAFSNSEMKVQNFVNPGDSVTLIKSSLNSACISKMIDKFTGSGCEIMFHKGQDDIINTFSCSRFKVRNDNVDMGYMAYNIEYWSDWDLKKEDEVVFCKDEKQIVYQRKVFIYE